MKVWLLLLMSATLWLGCDDDATPSSLPDAEREVDAAVDAGHAPDATPDVGLIPDAGPIAPLPPTPAVEPTPLTPDTWLRARVVGGDPVIGDLLRGTFVWPDVGVDARGVEWTEGTLDEGGAMGDPGRDNTTYAAIQLDVPDDRYAFAKASKLSGVYANGWYQPGDVYGHAEHRVPVMLQAGDDLIVGRGFGGRGSPAFEVWTTPDPLYLNPLDQTWPHLRVGHAEPMWLGLTVLNLTGAPAQAVIARVMESDDWHATAVEVPALPAGAATQVAFLLEPKAAWATAEREISVRVQVDSANFEVGFARDLTLPTVAADVPFRRTFRSPVDASVQYYGVHPPADFDAERDYALILSLHGAGVEAIGQANAYAAKDWAYVIAPTNRRRFGFDWEEWGHLNGVAALDHATDSFNIDPTRVYVTGHSMGGHGTWQFGVHHPGRFAVVAPSAGWDSFYTYGGGTPPSGAFDWPRRHSDTSHYLSNLARRGVYVIHGDADDNVPIREGRDMVAAAGEFVDDLVFHEEPGAGHWWDGDVSEGADCVDWPPLMDFMQAHTLDPMELDFQFRTSGPWYSAQHSFVTLSSVVAPSSDATVQSSHQDDTVVLITQNVRSLMLDGDALAAAGVNTVVVDRRGHPVAPGQMFIGSNDGKQLGQQGPFNQVFHRPFCFVYEDGATAYMRYAAYLTTSWALIGNGHACALPLSAVDDALRAERNLIYLGVAQDDVPIGLDFGWDADAITVGGDRHPGASLAMVFPEGERLSATILTTGDADALYTVMPFNSRSGFPDFLVWQSGALVTAGNLDPDWQLDDALRSP